MAAVSPHRQAVPDPQRGVVIGIDISKGHFDWRPCRLGSWGKHFQHPRSEAGFLAFEAHLQGFVAQGQEVWLGQEPTGPYGQCLQEWLLTRGWKLVLVNPYHVHRTKETRDNSPHKDDEKDPGVIADLIWHGQYHQPRRLEGPYAELRAGITEWYSLATARTALRNEAQALLEGWFPELTEQFENPLCLSAQSVIRRYEHPAAVVQAGKARLRATLKRGTHGKKVCYTEALWEAAQHSVALDPRPGEPRAGVAGPAGAARPGGAASGGAQGGAGPLAGPDAGGEVPAERTPSEHHHRRGAAGRVRAAGGVPEWASAGEVRGAAPVPRASGKRRGKFHLSKRGRSGARYLLGRLAAVHTQVGGLGGAWAKARKEQGVPALVIQTALARKLLGLLYALARDQRDFDAPHWERRTETADGHPYLQGAPLAA